MRKKIGGYFGSSYSLLLYLVIFTDKIDETLFYFYDGVDKRVAANLGGETILKIKDTKMTSRLGKIFYYRLREMKYNLILKKLKKMEKIYGQDHLIGASSLVKTGKFEIIEDGFSSYSFPNKVNQIKIVSNETNIKKAIKKILGIKTSKPYGVDSKIKKIYLTGMFPTPNIIKNKVEIISLKKLWDKKTEQEKEKILNIFNLKQSLVNEIKSKKIILITQTISEDGLVSEAEKIEIYREILKKYHPDEVIIKTHPREVTDYRKHFPNIFVLDLPFPVQILKLIGVKFDKIITLFSTAAKDFLDMGELEFYGTEMKKSFVDMYGIIRYNKEKNCIEMTEEKK